VEFGSASRSRVRNAIHSGDRPGGLDLDERGQGVVSHPRLFQLIRQSGPIDEHTFEITFSAGDVEAYVVTFSR